MAQHLILYEQCVSLYYKCRDGSSVYEPSVDAKIIRISVFQADECGICGRCPQNRPSFNIKMGRKCSKGTQNEVSRGYPQTKHEPWPRTRTLMENFNNVLYFYHCTVQMKIRLMKTNQQPIKVLTT